MKVGDLVKNRKTGSIGIVLSITRFHRYTPNLNLLRCFALDCSHHFEISERGLELISEKSS